MISRYPTYRVTLQRRVHGSDENISQFDALENKAYTILSSNSADARAVALKVAGDEWLVADFQRTAN